MEKNKKITYTVGDATVPQGEGVKIIMHVCNNVGAWGAGFVLALSKRWSEPKDCFQDWTKTEDYHLQQVMLCPVGDDTYVANMVAQNGLKSATNPVPLDYFALEICLERVRRMAEELQASVHCPKIGAGLAGGDWEIVEKLIEKHLTEKGTSVTVYTL